jgi:microcystin-dependent protein
MSQIISEIRLFAFDFAPRGWLLCDGRPLMINSNPPLFAIIGTTFGGDGKTYFNLPDLRGKVLLGQGNGYAIGNSGGEEMHALTIAEMAAHNHGATASTNNANATTPNNNFWPADGGYETTSNGQLSPMALAQTGTPQHGPFS